MASVSTSSRNQPCNCGSGIKAKRCKCKEIAKNISNAMHFIETAVCFRNDEIQRFQSDIANAAEKVMKGLMRDCGMNAESRNEFKVEYKQTPIQALKEGQSRNVLSRTYLYRNGIPVGYVESTVDDRSWEFTAHKIADAN